MDREYEINPDDEREVELDDENSFPPVAPTIDPDERVELIDDELELDDDERPVPL